MERLKREMGLGGSVFLGLGSIVGTGVFVSTGIAGPAVVLGGIRRSALLRPPLERQ